MEYIVDVLASWSNVPCHSASVSESFLLAGSCFADGLETEARPYRANILIVARVRTIATVISSIDGPIYL